MELNSHIKQKRIQIREGDVFLVKFDKYQKYFQYVADDMTQLNSRVIRVFKKEYPLGRIPDLTEVSSGEIDFHAHVIIRLGYKMILWEKIGKAPIKEDIEILFRNSKDYGENKEPISSKWYVWKINEKWQYVGKLTKKNRKAEIGIIVTPNDIVERIKTGKYNFSYPEFE